MCIIEPSEWLPLGADGHRPPVVGRSLAASPLPSTGVAVAVPGHIRSKAAHLSPLRKSLKVMQHRTRLPPRQRVVQLYKFFNNTRVARASHDLTCASYTYVRPSVITDSCFYYSLLPYAQTDRRTATSSDERPSLITAFTCSVDRC